MITYINGDATDPKVDGPKIIAHVCNDIGGWGRGFVLALSKRWKQPEQRYRSWSKSEEFALGRVLFVNVEADIIVANMVAQRDIVRNNGLPPIRYEALRECLETVQIMAQNTGSTVHMPRIGCGLAGGNWATVEQIIQSTITVSTYVYDL